MHTVLTSEDGQPLTIGVGLAERACGTDGTELIAQDQSEGWLSYWQPEDRPKGTTAVAILLPKDSITAFTNDAPDMPDAKIHANVPQVVGFLSLENGLILAAVGIEGMPLVVELSSAILVLLAFVVFGVFFFRIRERFDTLDVSRLDESGGAHR